MSHRLDYLAHETKRTYTVNTFETKLQMIRKFLTENGHTGRIIDKIMQTAGKFKVDNSAEKCRVYFVLFTNDLLADMAK